MDAMGDADEADGTDAWDDELRHLAGRSVWTPEAQAFTAAGLVLSSFFSQGLFQFLAFFIGDGDLTPGRQAIMSAGPGVVLAAVGAYVGWRARLLPSTPALRGLSVASAVVGVVMALAAAAGIVAALANDQPGGF
ncbi:MAG TPA: hypothetical protein VFR56_11135 [Actinomycetes bacterium]|nr:hypothetical protein [Actinomycetes bacterium]